ncbi:MAG: ribonuclease HII [bacterium]
MTIYLAGVDEAGRGPLVGAVVSAAVILDVDKPIDGLADSKKLSARRREALALEIKERAICWSIGRCDREEIDRLNILHASLLSMSRAIDRLSVPPDHVQVDGNRCPETPFPVEAIVKGDQKVAAISAASILAKVERDAEMLQLHGRYPEFGFDRHKGYPTRFHQEKILELGITPEHRLSFRPVREALALKGYVLEVAGE